MDKKIIRIVCLILVAIMLVGLIPAVALAAEPSGERTVYFTNDAGWSKVNIYYWADGQTNMVSWPGVAMTVEDGQIWSYTIPDSVGYVIFNDGSTQTSDLTLPADKNMYTYSTGAWSTYESACAHEWGTGTVTKAATCTDDGEMSYVCALCGVSRVAAIRATGHTMQGTTCTTCGLSMRMVYFEDTNGWSNVNIYYWSGAELSMVTWPGEPMTKGEDGIWSAAITPEVEYVIFNNGSEQTADLTLPADQDMYTHPAGVWSTYESGCAHEWGTGTVTKAATCTEDGEMSYVCTLCSASRVVSIEASGHNMQGNTCTTCGLSMRVVYFDNTKGWSNVNIYYWSDAESSMVGWPGVAMTKGEGDIWSAAISPEVQYVIFNNGTEQTDDLTLPSSENLYSDGVWSDYDTCAHSYDDGVITTEPGCTTEGVKTFTCTACGDSYTQTLDAVGHSFVDGQCSVCGAAQECTDHVWDDGVVTQEPGCWTFGSKTFTCTVCGATKTQSITPGHDLYVSEVIEPTCTKTGKQYTKCTRCAYSMDKTLPKIDHSYTIAGETVPVSCTEDGYTLYTCSGCTATQKGDLVYHAGHDWDGETCKVCGTVCQHSYVDGICTGCDAGGPAYVEGWYEIANAAQLYWFAAQVNGGNDAIDGRLVADIDLGGKSWTSIGYYCSDTLEPDTVPYTGTFDGQGHTVSNFVAAGTDNEGLFGYCSSATIKNVGVVGAKVTGWRAGAVVGYALTSNVLSCFAKDCVITGDTTNSVALLSGTVYIAPVAGPQGGVVRDCYAVDCTLVDATDLEVYTAPVGGVDTQNGYYHNVTYTAEFSSVRNSTEVTAQQLASGEVTYLLNKGVTDGSQSWYQTCGVGAPAHSGKTVYQVTKCDGSQIYDNTGLSSADHNFVDGVCTNCGAVEPVVQPTLTLKYPSLSFEAEILYNVYYTVENGEDILEMGLLTFGSELVDGTVEDADAVIGGYITDGSLWKVGTNGISAKALGDKLYFKVYAKLSDGSYVYSAMKSYSAVDYAATILGRDSSSANMKALVVAMLNYGTQAQLYFGHNTDALMNAGLTAEQQALVSAYDESMVDAVVSVDSAKAANFIYDGSSFARRAPTVSFDGAFAINYYFTTAKAADDGMTLYYWNIEDYDAAATLTLDNATGSMEMVATGTEDQFWGEVPGIAAKELDRTVFVVGVYQHEGVTYTTGVLNYSIGKYCVGLAAKETSDQCSFAQATAVYGYCAKEYFASL